MTVGRCTLRSTATGSRSGAVTAGSFTHRENGRAVCAAGPERWGFQTYTDSIRNGSGVLQHASGRNAEPVRSGASEQPEQRPDNEEHPDYAENPKSDVVAFPVHARVDPCQHDRGSQRCQIEQYRRGDHDRA